MIKKMIKGSLRLIGALYGSVIISPVTIIQAVLTIPRMMYMSRIDFIIFMLLFLGIGAGFLVFGIFGGAGSLLSIVGCSVFLCIVNSLEYCAPALAVTNGIKICAELFSNFEILEGIKRPFKVLRAQSNHIDAFMPGFNKTALPHMAIHRVGDSFEETKKNLIREVGLSTTAEIISCQVNETVSFYSHSDEFFKQLVGKAISNIMIQYLIDGKDGKLELMSEIKKQLIDKTGKRQKQYNEAAKGEYLSSDDKGFVSLDKQHQKLEERITSELEQCPIVARFVR